MKHLEVAVVLTWLINLELAALKAQSAFVILAETTIFCVTIYVFAPILRE